MPVRLDFGRLGNVTRTPQGGILVDAALTRVGVFPYRRQDGTEVREYRPAEEVFAPESLATLENAPVTDLHPPVLVTPENFQAYAGGHVAGLPVQDGDAAVGQLVIQRKDLVDGVDAGTRVENSCGYECDIDETPGSYQGQPYDVVQRRIRYNHVGIGPRGWGRQGPSVALRLDSVDAVQIPAEARKDGGFMKIRIPKVEYDRKAKTVRVDGVAHDMRTPVGRSGAMQAIVNAHVTMRSSVRTDAMDAATLQAALGDLMTGFEQLQQQLAAIANASAEEEAAEGDGQAPGQDPTAAPGANGPVGDSTAPGPAAAPSAPGDGATTTPGPTDQKVKTDSSDEARFNRYVETRTKAQKLAPEARFDGMSERKIMEAALGVAFPGLRLDSASDDYVRGMFAQATVRNDAADASFASVAGAANSPASSSAPKVEEKRTAMRKDTAEAWKKPLGPNAQKK